MFLYKMISGGPVFIAPAHVVSIMDLGKDKGCIIYTVDGQKWPVLESAEEVAHDCVHLLYPNAIERLAAIEGLRPGKNNLS